MQLIEDVGFDQSFSFLYSRRPGTPAASLPDEVPHATKQHRLETLQARINREARAISARMVGRVERVLVERPSPGGMRASSRGAPRTTAGSISTARRVSWTSSRTS